MEIKEQELKLTYKFLKEKYPKIFQELANYVLINLKKPKGDSAP